MNVSWKDMSVVQKVGTVIAYAICGVSLVLMLLRYLNVLNLDFNPSAPAFAAGAIAQIFTYWNANRRMSYVCIFIAVLLTAYCVLEIFF